MKKIGLSTASWQAVDLLQYTEPVKAGYTFLGWAESTDGDVVDTVTLSDNLTLYAVWLKDGSNMLRLNNEKATVYTDGVAVLMLASFDEDDRLIDCVQKVVSENCSVGVSEVGLDMTGAHTVKAFLFDEKIGLRPLCQAGDILIK